VRLLISYNLLGVQNSFRTSTFYSSQGPYSCCIPSKSISVGRRSLVSTIKTIPSLIKYILTIVSCVWQLHHSQYRLQKLSHSKYIQLKQVFLRRFRDPIRVPRISNRVPKIRENRAPRIREIGSLQIQTGFLTFSLKKPWLKFQNMDKRSDEIAKTRRKVRQVY